ncbi:hypothetical protein PQX77_020261 [Marasmius sp. AFHP31]|nr:hypothetical protein PQX77_020261 [Marasmius sp. AFHP31]
MSWSGLGFIAFVEVQLREEKGIFSVLAKDVQVAWQKALERVWGHNLETDAREENDWQIQEIGLGGQDGDYIASGIGAEDCNENKPMVPYILESTAGDYLEEEVGRGGHASIEFDLQASTEIHNTEDHYSSCDEHGALGEAHVGGPDADNHV